MRRRPLEELGGKGTGGGVLTGTQSYWRSPLSQQRGSSKLVFSLQTPTCHLPPPPLFTTRCLGPGGAGAGRQANWTVTGAPLGQSPGRHPSSGPR